MRGLSPKNQGRLGIAFGSYGWAPLGPKQVAEQLANTGFEMPIETMACNWIPDDKYLADVREQVRALVRGE
jgi:flavorubredoxin